MPVFTALLYLLAIVLALVASYPPAPSGVLLPLSVASLAGAEFLARGGLP